ncbi:MAG: DUF2460 domain-containing protein [Cohaesibacter sp.]|nr:DUF2460 domain-containing protein [Cohaesibacter sp.]
MTYKGFHEALFPLEVGFGSSGGPERRTDIVALSSGFEQRNARWADSRRRYEAGFGVRSLSDLQKVIAFFEERRGRLYGFRFRDPLDHTSCKAGQEIAATDQILGTGDGSQTKFQLIKRYGSDFAPYSRTISKPVAGSVIVAVNGADQPQFDLDEEKGEITLPEAPPSGHQVTAGFRFDVPVRFDSDQLDLSLHAFEAGEIPALPLVEIRI